MPTLKTAPEIPGLPHYVTVASLARHLNATPQSVRNWASDGTLPKLRRIGSKLLFRRDEVEQAIARMEAAAAVKDHGNLHEDEQQ